MHSWILPLLLAGNPTAPPTEIWPQWRGPTADSVSPIADLPMQWGPKENVRWKVPLPGWGTSTPAIWRDTIFVTAQKDEHLLLLSLDAKNGAVKWEREVGQGTPRRKGPVGIGRYHDEHNMASPSPITDGQLVWVHYGNGDTACYDFAGKQVWAKNLTEKFGPYTIWWGHANTPVLVGDLLVSACMQDPKDGGKSYVVAHDKRTGEERWHVDRNTGATAEPADSYTTPLVHQVGDSTEILVYGGNVLDAYDPANGKRRWESKVFKGNRVISGPTLAGDTVYAIQGMKGPVFAIKTGGEGDVTATHLRWSYKGGTPDAASPVIVNDLVFLANNAGTAICLDAKSGEELWKERLADGFRATPLVAGGKIYFFGKEGKTTIAAAARVFQKLAENQLGEDVTASPAVAHGDLFIRTKVHLYRIGK
jgi:outer membrane protein assembly factor BamB